MKREFLKIYIKFDVQGTDIYREMYIITKSIPPAMNSDIPEIP